MPKKELEKITDELYEKFLTDFDIDETDYIAEYVQFLLKTIARKTAERIFKELEKIEEEYWQEYCTQSDRIGVYIQAQAIEKAIKKLRKGFLGDENDEKDGE